MSINPEIITLAGNLCFTLIFFSFLVRKMIILRSLSVCAGFASMFYNYNVSIDPLWTPISWNFIFVITNLIQIGMILWESREVKFEGYEKYLFENVLKHLSPGEFKKVIEMATLESCEADSTLIEEGVEFESLLILVDGKVDIQMNGRSVAELKAGNFVGEMSFLTNSKTRALCKTSEYSHFYSWPKAELKELLFRSPSKMSAFQAAMGTQLIEELMAKTELEEIKVA